MINYGNHFVDKEDLKKITKPLSEKFLTSGKYLNFFENKIKNYLKCKYVIVCSSGTSTIFSNEIIKFKKMILSLYR